MMDRLNLDERDLRAEIARLRALAEGSPGTDGWIFGAVLASLGIALQQNGRWDEAFDALREATIVQRRLSPDDPGRASALLHFAWLLRDRERVGEAQDLVAEAI